ncbi:hypothetical protein T01_6227 [Trichinella spiralis]|uniref:Uncharacterized protein n=1 Tax=Trichinella spiralis TaxID=6334 RepID=A0A0V1AK40_TRISP|nr:hypothetical protein T01_6227 [Trichinella spiralis]
MVEASHVAEPATPSLKQHPYPAEEVILVAPYIRHVPADMWVENYFEIITSIPERERLKIFLIWK